MDRLLSPDSSPPDSDNVNPIVYVTEEAPEALPAKIRHKITKIRRVLHRRRGASPQSPALQRSGEFSRSIRGEMVRTVQSSGVAQWQRVWSQARWIDRNGSRQPDETEQDPPPKGQDSGAKGKRSRH